MNIDQKKKKKRVNKTPDSILMRESVIVRSLNPDVSTLHVRGGVFFRRSGRKKKKGKEKQNGGRDFCQYH